MPSFSSFLPPLVGAVVGMLLKALYDVIAARRRFKKELEDNDNIDVTGEWHAAWQTSVDGAELINTEHIKMLQKGKTVKVWNTEKSPENPKAGFLWESQSQFLQGRNLMGWYFAKAEESNASKGILYLSYLSPRKLFFGKWVGTAYDGELITGCVVFSKVRAEAKLELQRFIAAAGQITLIGYTGVGKDQAPT